MKLLKFTNNQRKLTFNNEPPMRMAAIHVGPLHAKMKTHMV